MKIANYTIEDFKALSYAEKIRFIANTPKSISLELEQYIKLWMTHNRINNWNTNRRKKNLKW